MTIKVSKPKSIRPLEGYTNMTDADVVARAMAVLTGMTGNSNFQNLPVDLPTFKIDIDSLSTLISEALDGSKKVVARKNKQREVVIKSLKLLARFVEVHSNGDEAIFTSSGFQPASSTKTPPAVLPLPIIRSVDHGAITGEIVVLVESIPRAKSYEFRFGAVLNGAPSPVPKVRGGSTDPYGSPNAGDRFRAAMSEIDHGQRRTIAMPQGRLRGGAGSDPQERRLAQ